MLTIDQQEILRFISDELLEDDLAITPSTSLFQTKILDSMNLTQLVSYLERHFKIRVKPLDIAFENLDTVENMVRFVQRKLEA